MGWQVDKPKSLECIHFVISAGEQSKCFKSKLYEAETLLSDGFEVKLNVVWGIVSPKQIYGSALQILKLYLKMTFKNCVLALRNAHEL